MATPQIPSIARALRERGTTVNEWSRTNRFPHRNVYRVINEWIESPTRRGSIPLGGLGRQILRALQRDLGPELVPINHQPEATDQAA